VNKSVFGRGFEAFGKPIPIRGTVPAAPIPVAQVAAPAPRPSLAVPKQAVTRTIVATGETFEHLSEQDRNLATGGSST